MTSKLHSFKAANPFFTFQSIAVEGRSRYQIVRPSQSRARTSSSTFSQEMVCSCVWGQRHQTGIACNCQNYRMWICLWWFTHNLVFKGLIFITVSCCLIHCWMQCITCQWKKMVQDNRLLLWCWAAAVCTEVIGLHHSMWFSLSSFFCFTLAVLWCLFSVDNERELASVCAGLNTFDP